MSKFCVVYNSKIVIIEKKENLQIEYLIVKYSFIIIFKGATFGGSNVNVREDQSPVQVCVQLQEPTTAIYKDVTITFTPKIIQPMTNRTASCQLYINYILMIMYFFIFVK